MTLHIERPAGLDALTEFVQFFDRAHASRSARWPVPLELHLPILMGESPFCEGREFQPLAARQNGEIVARATALIDRRYQQHWNEPLGHIASFDALPGTGAAVRALLQEACEWLEGRGANAARAGFATAALEFPFAADAYDVLPPSLLRQNGDHYHVLLKQAGFEVERGCVDYKLEVTEALREQWAEDLARATRAGYEIVPLKALEPGVRVREVAENWADTFSSHWGFAAFTEPEIELLLAALADTSLLDTSVIAFHEGRSVGFLFNASDHSEHAVLAPGRELAPAEKLNNLGVGVRAAARGRGVNLAMAGYSYLELANRGWTHLSYTLVLDDNWASRRTGERLGCEACANYLIYRRNFRSVGASA